MGTVALRDNQNSIEPPSRRFMRYVEHEVGQLDLIRFDIEMIPTDIQDPRLAPYNHAVRGDKSKPSAFAGGGEKWRL